MTGQKQRTQILLEPEQHKALVEIARQEKRSISDIVRHIVNQHLEERTRDAKRQRAIDALERLTCLRERIEQRSGMYQGDLIAAARAERDEQIEQSLGPETKGWRMGHNRRE
jgi:predicted DNA-binding ribbon-helix-helix protein